jgi:hypothetical protein
MCQMTALILTTENLYFSGDDGQLISQDARVSGSSVLHL